LTLEIINKIFHEIEKDLYDFKVKGDISNAIIPFSALFNENKPSDIYNGEETILFKNKNPEFKQILINEFLTEYKEINNSL